MRKWILGLLVAAQALAVAPVFAGSRGRLNSAGLLTGAAVYAWVRNGQNGSAGRRNTAIATTAGAAYAWHRYNKAKKTERNRERARAAYYKRLAARNARNARYYRTRYNRAVARTRYARR